MIILSMRSRFISYSECHIYGGQYQFLVEADKPVTRYMVGQIQTRLGYPSTSYGLLDVHSKPLTDGEHLSTWYCFAVKTSRYDRFASSSTTRYAHGNKGNRYAAKELTT